MLVYQLESTHDSLVIAANLSQPEEGTQPSVAFCSFHFHFSPTAMALFLGKTRDDVKQPMNTYVLFKSPRTKDFSQ